MNDIDVETFADLMLFLDPCPDASRKYDTPGSMYTCQKAHMIAWFASQTGTGEGSFTRNKGNNSARTCYNRLLNAGALVWIADAFGADGKLIEQAAKKAEEAKNYRSRCSAFRSVIPFDSIIELLLRPQGWRYDQALLPFMEFDADGYPSFKQDKTEKVDSILSQELGC
ncbi:MAG: hypothetical protein IJH45_01455 [Firmicutes bacterium]|nr:hypothetical protein [Bacillota bacterium]